MVSVATTSSGRQPHQTCVMFWSCHEIHCARHSCRVASASRQDSPREGELAASQVAVEPSRAILPTGLEHSTFMMAPSLDSVPLEASVGAESFSDFGSLSMPSMDSPNYDHIQVRVFVDVHIAVIHLSIHAGVRCSARFRS